MDIFLKSRSDAVSWASVFRILGYELCLPIWKIIEVPEVIADNPSSVLDIAKSFFIERSSLWSRQRMTSETEVENHFEAQRMIDLGRLYDCFGRIVKAYGETTARELYDWGERHFINEKAIFWWTWRSIFYKQLRRQLPLTSFVNSNQQEWLNEIIKHQFEKELLRAEKLEIEFDILGQNFSAKPQEITLLNDVSISDIIIFNNFDDVKEELRNIFDFEGILTRDCAYRIWQQINADFEKEVRKNIFQWGDRESRDMSAELDWNLRDYCLSI